MKSHDTKILAKLRANDRTPLAAESAGLSPVPFSGGSATSAVVLTKMKLRLAAPPSTVAGTYTNNVSVIVTPIY